LTLNISETVRDKKTQAYNEILIGTYDTPYSTVSFRMALSDIAKYSVTRSIAGTFCDSWASCKYRWDERL